MYDRLSEHARSAMSAAREAALELHHDHLAPAHLLLGVLDEPAGGGARAITSLGVDLSALRGKVRGVLRPGTPSAVAPTQLPFNDRAKHVLESSVSEAAALGHQRLGTEHLLLGLIGEAHGLATTALHSMGLDHAKLQIAVRNL